DIRRVDPVAPTPRATGYVVRAVRPRHAVGGLCCPRIGASAAICKGAFLAGWRSNRPSDPPAIEHIATTSRRAAQRELLRGYASAVYVTAMRRPAKLPRSTTRPLLTRCVITATTSASDLQ